MTNLVLILLGGIFGWLLGKLPDKYVYVVMAIVVVLLILELT